MARAVGSHTSVQNIWRAQSRRWTEGLQRAWEKVEDVVGLYLDPPDKAVVFRSTRRAKSRHSTANRACP